MRLGDGSFASEVMMRVAGVAIINQDPRFRNLQFPISGKGEQLQM